MPETTPDKTTVRNTYNMVAGCYDHPANFFSKVVAESMLNGIQLGANKHLLDVGTGTGVVALTAAKQLPDSQITGIDLSPSMIQQAKQKADLLCLKNANFQVADMEQLGFSDQSFDVITSCFSLYFLANMSQGLQHFLAKLKLNGKVIISFYRHDAFQPLIHLFNEHYALFRPETAGQSEAWLRLSDKASAQALFAQSGIQNGQIAEQALGFELRSSHDWWNLLWSTGYRPALNKLANIELETFKQLHLSAVDELCLTNPYWIDTPVLIASGHKLNQSSD